MPTSATIDGSAMLGRRADQAIATASRRTGVDFDYLMNQANIESGMNPSARARTSSAVGLFQFTKQTWLTTLKTHGAEHGLGWAADAITQSPDGTYRVDNAALRASILDLRTDPDAASAMAAEFAADNAAHLGGELGRQAEPVDLYLAHFLGANGAVQFLNAYDANPDAAAAPLLPKAAAANKAIFYEKDGSARTVGEIRQLFAAKISGGGASARLAATHSSGNAALHRQSRTASLPASEATPQMLRIEPMPKSLSLRFAAQAYQRLAGMNGGVR